MAKVRTSQLPSFSVVNFALAKGVTSKSLSNYYTKEEVDEMISSGAESATDEEIALIIEGMYA